MTAEIMLDGFLSDGWKEPFPYKIRVVKNGTAAPLFYRESEGKVLTRISKESICDTILDYWSKQPATRSADLTQKYAAEALNFFRAYAESLTETIKPVAFKSDDSYTFYRLEFDPYEALTPTFDEMMSRSTNPLAIQAYIGSMLDFMSECQQYMWLYGPGGNGKSRLVHFLKKLFGGAAVSATVAGHDGRFWTSQFLNKRVVLFPDTDNYNFVNCGLFKSMCGGDSIRMEHKGGAIFDAELACKFVFSSNQRPNIEDEPSAARRVIYGEFAPVTNKKMPDHIYNALLWSEAPAILHKCMALYKVSCPDHGAIANEEGVLLRINADSEERWETVARRHLHLWDKGFFDTQNLNARPRVEPMVLLAIKEDERLSEIEYRRFKDYLERNYGVIKHRLNIGLHSPKWFYIHCTVKSDFKQYNRFTVVENSEEAER